MSYQKMITTTTTMIAAVTAGLLFSIVPTITGLSFADDGSAAAPTTSDQQKSGSDSSPSSTQTSSDQPTKQDDQPKTKVQGGPDSSPCEAQQCDKDGKPMTCSPHCFPPTIKIIEPTKVIVHHTTTTKTVHDGGGRNLTVAQQNCVYGALQLGFSSSAQNRADATYAAILGCFGSS